YAENELEKTVSLLRATLEGTADGIVVIDRGGHISTFNRKFLDLWQLPDKVLATGEIDPVRDHISDQLVDPAALTPHIEALDETPHKARIDNLLLKDGRVYEYRASPQRLGDEIVGRVWSFRDVSDRLHAQHELDRLLAQEQAGRTRAAFLADV